MPRNKQPATTPDGSNGDEVKPPFIQKGEAAREALSRGLAELESALDKKSIAIKREPGEAWGKTK